MQRYKGETEIMGWPWISVRPKKAGGAHSAVIITPSGYIACPSTAGGPLPILRCKHIVTFSKTGSADTISLRKSSCFLSAAASRARTTFALQRCGFRRGRGRVRLPSPSAAAVVVGRET